MGYDLHTTRRSEWSDSEENQNDISLKEWLSYIKTDNELQLSNTYQIKVPGSKTDSMIAPGFCEWINHPSNEKPYFDYHDGNISTKNPDEDTIKKMIAIAKLLNAKVQSDDVETYSLP